MGRPLSGRRKYREVIQEAEVAAEEYNFDDYKTSTSPTIRHNARTRTRTSSTNVAENPTNLTPLTIMQKGVQVMWLLVLNGRFIFLNGCCNGCCNGSFADTCRARPE